MKFIEKWEERNQASISNLNYTMPQSAAASFFTGFAIFIIVVIMSMRNLGITVAGTGKYYFRALFGGGKTTNLLSLLVMVVLLASLSSCDQKKQFTNLKVRDDAGNTYVARVIEPRVSVPDSGEVIPIISTESTQGWLYNSKAWTLNDSDKNLKGLPYRKVVFGQVTEVIYPKKQ